MWVNPIAFFAVNSNMSLVFSWRTKILSDARFKFEENLYLYYITESMYRFVRHFPVHYSLVTLSFDAMSFGAMFFQTFFYSQLRIREHSGARPKK
jgi:hypothetical protein